MRYRIRKKRSLAQLAIALSDLYSDVQPVTSSTSNSHDSTSTRSGSGLNGSSVGSVNQSSNDLMQDGLLPAIANMDRVERRARIRELLDEVSNHKTHEESTHPIYPHIYLFAHSSITLLVSFLSNLSFQSFNIVF